MELDVNIDAHDLLCRSMSLADKQAYVKSWGTLRDKLIEKEIVRLVEAGYAVKRDDTLELTAEGKTLYKK